nr:unnamed protein product [Callosobruchus chinensis]
MYQPHPIPIWYSLGS